MKIYTTPTCPYCRAEKQFLKQNNVHFEEVDVSRDNEAAHEMIEKSGQMGVPVTEIDGKIIVGFDREAIAKALGLR